MPKKYGRSVFLFFGCWDGDTRYVLRSVPHDCAGVPQDLKRLRGQGLLSQGFGGHKSIVKHHSCHRHASQKLQFLPYLGDMSMWMLCGQEQLDSDLLWQNRVWSENHHLFIILSCLVCNVMLLMSGTNKSNFHFCCGANIRHVCIYVCMIHTIESIHLHYLMYTCIYII